MPLGCHYKWAKVHWEVKIQMSPKKQGDLGKQDRLFFFFFFFSSAKLSSFQLFFPLPFQFTHAVMSNSLRPHGLQHARLPCPSPTPRAFSNACPSSQRCHPTISSFVIPFSSCPQSFPASGSFPISAFFTSGSQSIGVSASASVLPMNTQD